MSLNCFECWSKFVNETLIMSALQDSNVVNFMQDILMKYLNLRFIDISILREKYSQCFKKVFFTRQKIDYDTAEAVSNMLEDADFIRLVQTELKNPEVVKLLWTNIRLFRVIDTYRQTDLITMLKNSAPGITDKELKEVLLDIEEDLEGMSREYVCLELLSDFVQARLEWRIKNKCESCWKNAIMRIWISACLMFILQ